MKILKEAMDLMFPKSCEICGRVSDLSIRRARVCSKCMSFLVPAPKQLRWQFCLSEPRLGDPHSDLALYVPFGYDGIVHRMVHGVKFGSKETVGDLMGFLLGQALLADNVTASAVIPVPLSSSRLRERGFNQAEVIGRAVSEVLNIPIMPDVLMRTRDTARQARCKDNEHRAANVDGAFKADPAYDLSGATVLLVDDVATTGNTLREAADALYATGVSKILCVAFASNRVRKNAETY